MIGSFSFNTFVVFCIEWERKQLILVFHLNNYHLCASITSSELRLTVTADIMTVTAHPCPHISQYFTVKCCTVPTCVWEESPRLQYVLEQLAHEWVSAGQHECVCVCVGGGRRTDKCWGQRLRQACPLEGRRSSWAEYIYRAAFLRIGLLSNWAPVAPRHPHPPVVGDLCGGAAALRSRLRLLSLFNQSAARKYIFEVLVLQIHVSLLF